MNEEVMVVVTLIGDGFVSLQKKPGEWVWTAIGENQFGEFVERRGYTPLEAVQDLWINLTEVKTEGYEFKREETTRKD